MLTSIIPFCLTNVGHERAHEDCVANVTVRIPSHHLEAILDPDHTLEYNPEEWVITSIEIDEDTEPYLASLLTDKSKMCLAILHHLMKNLDEFDELVREHFWEYE